MEVESPSMFTTMVAVEGASMVRLFAFDRSSPERLKTLSSESFPLSVIPPWATVVVPLASSPARNVDSCLR